MPDIERLSLKLIELLSNDGSSFEIYTAWQEYYKLWPDVGKAYGYLQNVILVSIVDLKPIDKIFMMSKMMNKLRNSLNKSVTDK